MTNQNCTLCHKKLYRNISLKCNLCSSKFHLKCCTPTDRTYSKSNLPWYCIECNPFPFAQLSNVELNDQFNNSRAENNKIKCSGCKKKIIRNTRFKQCKQCRSPYHIRWHWRMDMFILYFIWTPPPQINKWRLWS